uniref:Solute carrier family 2, facilitated glucose transporter member 5 n=1 Tax=Electrophorus electricus TaxID=8005 RepID=A0A4W4G426_ELEEL
IGKLTLVLALATLVSAFGSSFQYGYNVAVVNSPALVPRFYARVYESRNASLTDSSLTLLWSLTVSMYPLGGFFGSLMVAPLVNNLGRKGTLLFNNIFSIGPAVMMGVSEMVGSFEIIIVARFIVGICAGLSSNVVPMYLGELAPKNLRGAIGIVPQLFITVGILTAQVFGVRSILGNAESWPIMLALTGGPAVIELLLLPFFPESPRYMLIQKGDENNARKGTALRRLRGWEEVDEELLEMRLEEQSERAEGQLSVLRLFTFPSLRWQLLSIIFMNMGQQLSGVNAVRRTDNLPIFGSAGVKENDVQYVTVGTGSVNVLMTFVFMVEASGRKLLLLIGFGICCAACLLLTAALSLQVHTLPPASQHKRIFNLLPVCAPTGPIPTVITTEIFRQSSRPAAFLVAGSVHWLCNFTVGLVFPFLEQKGLGAYSFIIFAFICLVTLIYIWVVIPETKNTTFLEISKLFAKRNKVEIVLEAEDCELKVRGVRDHGEDLITTF